MVHPLQEVHIRWLSFRLRNGQSIAPGKLKEAWSNAAQTSHCAVKRDSLQGGVCVYGLYAPERLISPRDAELRMREFLSREGYVFTMGALRGDGASAAAVQKK